MIHLKKCKTCGFLAQNSGKCRITGQVKQAEDFCDRHNYNPPVCSRCGAYTLQPIIEDDKYYCHKCADEIEGCPGCAHANQCEFETNPSATPKFVQRQIRQGNAISIQTVKNPKRVEEFCPKCQCWNATFNDCDRQFNYCPNHSWSASHSQDEEKESSND